MFLFTTNKYSGEEKMDSHFEWEGLKRTKIIVEDYSPLSLSPKLRKFCRENKIDRLVNIGNYFGCIPILFATLLSKRDYVINFLSDILNQYKIAESLKYSSIFLLKLFVLYPLVFFSTKVLMNDINNFRRAPIFFLTKMRKINYLPPPIDTSFYKPMNKIEARKKLQIPPEKKVIIFVGRVNYLKCSDILKKVVEKNKDILFLVIGEVLDKDLLKFNCPNLKLLGKKPSSELPSYYNSSDLGFFINRGGAGMGFANIEAVACGIPILVSNQFDLIKSKSLFIVSLSFPSVNKTIQKFFTLSPNHREKLSSVARQYAIKNYSEEKWKEKYIEGYLD